MRAHLACDNNVFMSTPPSKRSMLEQKYVHDILERQAIRGRINKICLTQMNSYSSL